jgi:hypothetical protein
VYETNTPETKEEARDMIKKIISGEIQVKKFGTLMGNIGLCAFDLFDSDSEFQEKIIQSLLQIFPEGYRTCGQSIGNRYEATSEEEYSESDDEKIYPESGDSWNRRVQQYLNYSNVYFCIPDRTNKVEPLYINSDEIYAAVSVRKSSLWSFLGLTNIILSESFKWIFRRLRPLPSNCEEKRAEISSVGTRNFRNSCIFD